MNQRDVPFDEAGFEKNRLDTVENVSLLVIFFRFFGDGGGFGENIFRSNLIFDKYLKLCFPKVFFNLKPLEV